MVSPGSGTLAMYWVVFIVVAIFMARVLVGTWSAAEELWRARFHIIVGVISNMFAPGNYP